MVEINSNINKSITIYTYFQDPVTPVIGTFSILDIVNSIVGKDDWCIEFWFVVGFTMSY